MDPELYACLQVAVGFAVYCLGIKKGEAYGLAKGRRDAEAVHRTEMCALNIKLLVAKGVLPPE
jgi:hypothetical protein